MAVTVDELVAVMQRVAPVRWAEPWDNVGLLVGGGGEPLRGPVLLTIDLTAAVMEEAESLGAGVIVAYHPPIFSALKQIGPGVGKGELLLRAIRAGMAIYSPHTALDAAPGGVADWLLDCVLHDAARAEAGVAGRERGALTAHLEHDPQQAVKLVVFVPNSPRELPDQMIDALAAAGAGRIGRYTHCGFAAAGRGSFMGGEGSNPAVGKAGRRERVDEVRLEMVCARQDLPSAIAALRAVHPYEEPACDVYALEARPEVGIGAGRWGQLDVPVDVRTLAQRLKRNLGVASVRLADAAAGKMIERVGVCPGAGAALVDAAMAAGCDLFVTGEMRHHEVLAALERGLSVLLAGHSNTERGYLPILAARMRVEAAELDIKVSERDRWRLEELR